MENTKKTQLNDEWFGILHEFVNYGEDPSDEKYIKTSVSIDTKNEKIKTSDVWNSIIQKKFTYISELNQKDDILIKKFSVFINSQFEFVDYDGPDDGILYEDVDQDLIINEFSTFLSII